MAKKKTGTKAAGTQAQSEIVSALKASGFDEIKCIDDRIIHASVSSKSSIGNQQSESFCTAHAAFLQNAGNVSAFRFPTATKPVLVIHLDRNYAPPASAGPAEPPADESTE